MGSDLLARLTSFLNLQKTANISAPGVIVAAAVLLVFFSGSPPRYDEVPRAYSADSAALMQFTQSSACEVLSYDWYPKGGIGGRLTSANWATLENRRQKLDDCTYRLQQRIVTELDDIARKSGQADADQALATALAKQYQEEELRGLPYAGETGNKARQHQTTVNGERADIKKAEARVAFFNSLLPRLLQESKELVQIVHASDTLEPFEAAATKFGGNLLAFILFAIVCGLVIDPVMALLQPVLYTDQRVKRLNAAVQGVRVPPRQANITAYNLNYARGLGLLSDADIDALTRQYLYPSQMLLNLMVAGTLFLPAAGLFLKTHWDAIQGILK